MTLVDTLTREPLRAHIVVECCELVDAEVKSKGGLSGIAVKGAYRLVKAVKSGFVREVIDGMLNDWVAKLDPYYLQWQKKSGGKSLSDYMIHRKDEISESLLAVTDQRAKSARSAGVKKMYMKLRPAAKKHVEQALPSLGRLVERNVQ